MSWRRAHTIQVFAKSSFSTATAPRGIDDGLPRRSILCTHIASVDVPRPITVGQIHDSAAKYALEHDWTISHKTGVCRAISVLSMHRGRAQTIRESENSSCVPGSYERSRYLQFSRCHHTEALASSRRRRGDEPCIRVLSEIRDRT